MSLIDGVCWIFCIFAREACENGQRLGKMNKFFCSRLAPSLTREACENGRRLGRLAPFAVI